MSTAPPPARSAHEAAVVTFWDITRHQFRRNRPAMVALRCLQGLVVTACVAPLVTMNVPYLMKTPQGLEWTLFDRFFDRLLFPGGVDVFFNLLLVLGPFWWLGGHLARSVGPRPDGQKTAWSASLLVTLALLCGLWGMGPRGEARWTILAGACAAAIALVALAAAVRGGWRAPALAWGLPGAAGIAGLAAVVLVARRGVLALDEVTWSHWRVLLAAAAPLLVLAAAAAASRAVLDRARVTTLAAAGALIAGLLAIVYGVLDAAPRSIFGWILVAGVAGVAFQLARAHRARPLNERLRRDLQMRTRFVLAGLFLAMFVVVLGPLEYTSRVRTYRTEIAQLERTGAGWALRPPIFLHPDNIGEASDVVTTRITKPPSWERGNLLGTDNNGRDVFSRILFGTRISLTVGVIAVSIYTTIGILLGGLAGYFGGWIDMLIVGMLQVMLCIPWIFLLLTIIAVFDTRSIFMIMVAIGLTGWPGITRLVRGEFFRQRGIDYVVAAVALGLPRRRIIFGHILKNAIGPVLVAAAFGVAGAILAESFLSFLGLGDTNAPSWGQILMEGRNQRENWLILSPGIAIFFVVTVLNLVGDGLRDALDPRLRQ